MRGIVAFLADLFFALGGLVEVREQAGFGAGGREPTGRKSTMNGGKAERMVVLVGLLAALLACKKLTNRSEGSSSGGGGESVGVAECDEFLAKYEKCLKNIPAVARPGVEASIKQMRQSFKQTAAQGSAAKAGLTSVCKQSQENMKSSMSAYNCQW
jgi:hypothetical protein